jgi:hypothetical protein
VDDELPAGTIHVVALRNVESRLERLFERGLTLPFRNTLQPVEIGQRMIRERMIREMDLTRQVAQRGLIAPNHFKVWLSPADADRLEGFQQSLVGDLREFVRQHAVDEGYNFVGPVIVEVFVDDDRHRGNLRVKATFVDGASDPRIVSSTGAVYPLGKKPLVVGRSADCDIVIIEPRVSRRHAEFWVTPGGVAVRDLKSTNGTTVNGHAITAVSLSPADEVEIGSVTLRIELA